MVMKIIVCILIGYLIGTLNPAYFISKMKGFDIRKKGSGNAGASNALIVLGKAAGVMCAVFDMALNAGTNKMLLRFPIYLPWNQGFLL